MTLSFHPHAHAELRGLAAWYEDQRQGLGADLRDDVWRALGAIVEHPNRWPLSTIAAARALGVRHFVIRRFRLSVEYLIDDDAIQVIAVAYMSRRPGYWLRRLARRRGVT